MQELDHVVRFVHYLHFRLRYYHCIAKQEREIKTCVILEQVHLSFLISLGYGHPLYGVDELKCILEGVDELAQVEVSLDVEEPKCNCFFYL